MYLRSLIGTLIHSFACGFRSNKAASLPSGREGPRWQTGVPRLIRDQEAVRCVACALCASACPSRCIDLQAGWREGEEVSRMPVRFDLDLSRCVFCGLCVEACPHEAIEMGYSRSLPLPGKAGQLLQLDRDALLLAGHQA